MIPQLERETTISSSDSVPQWSLATKFVFRFIFSYFLIYVYPYSVGSRGASSKLTHPITHLWEAVVPWVGTDILHIPGSYPENANGSGDQLYDYVMWLCVAGLAVIVAVVWSAVDRKRPNYRVLYEWLRIFMRLTVAGAMIAYGLCKLFPMQFPPFPLWRLVDTYGQTHPMGLLWTFMEASRGYAILGGVGEFTGGILLIFPSFTTLGALISFGMMSNVFALNVFYDVPRKIFCVNLLLMCVFLILPDAKRMFDLFFLNRTAKLYKSPPMFKDKKFNLALLLLQYLVGISLLVAWIQTAHSIAVTEAAQVDPQIRGIWVVDEFAVDNIQRPPLVTDTGRWRRVIFDAPDALLVQGTDGIMKEFPLQLDFAHKTFTLGVESHVRGTFTMDESHPGQVVLDGMLDGHHLNAMLKREDLSDRTKFILINRGVHWITDAPHNR